MLWCLRGGQRITFKTWFSPSATRVLIIRFEGKLPCLLSYLICLLVLFNSPLFLKDRISLYCPG